jgi:hypothetical protein
MVLYCNTRYYCFQSLLLCACFVYQYQQSITIITFTYLRPAMQVTDKDVKLAAALKRLRDDGKTNTPFLINSANWFHFFFSVAPRLNPRAPLLTDIYLLHLCCWSQRWRRVGERSRSGYVYHYALCRNRIVTDRY